ncbi:MAG TPA: damage-inducible protein DinB, partial [Afipia sp.]|nr:damage-inducible protein DinB [Afipia sp.]
MAGGLTRHFRMFGHYNAWANARLYEAAGRLGDADYRADRGAFFKSVHGTLNHLLATDRIWMKRFTGEGDAPDRLDAA